MTLHRLAATIALLAALTLPAFASAAKCSSCARDSRGKIQRSATARQWFRRSHPCPATGRTSGACPGYVIDHIQALKRGGSDVPGNMQWQTRAEAKAKDRIE